MLKFAPPPCNLFIFQGCSFARLLRPDARSSVAFISALEFSNSQCTCIVQIEGCILLCMRNCHCEHFVGCVANEREWIFVGFQP